MRRLLISRFMNRSTVMIMVALLAGLVAAWSAQQHIRGKIAQLELQAQVPELERVVAAYDLPEGTLLEGHHFAVRRFPVGTVSSDSLSPARYTELEGTTLRSSLAAGDLVLPAHVRSVRHSAFSTQLLNGRRAITMPVDEINSVSGLLQPGDLIDLYVSFEYQRRRITAPLLQGVLVLATGSSTQQTDTTDPLMRQSLGNAYSTVTLDTDPEDAVKLVAARQSGIITAVLRNPEDASPSTKASRGDLATLLGVNRDPPPRPTRKVPVLYGNTAVRSVPRLRTPVPGPRQLSGVFDLPYTPTISSGRIRVPENLVGVDGVDAVSPLDAISQLTDTEANE